MILIIDNYDSFTFNLVHLVAVDRPEYKVVRNDEITVDEVKRLNPSKILISPGPGRPENAGITENLIAELGPEIPILGVCLGHQAIGHVYGANVIHAPTLMHGKTSKVYHDSQTIFRGVENGFTATRYHSLALERESVSDEIFEISAWTDDKVVMGIRHKFYPLEGIQFHPESILTTEGPKIIRNWLKKDFKIKAGKDQI